MGSLRGSYRAVAVLRGAPEVSGAVCLYQKAESGPCFIYGEIFDLKPGLHGFHVHQFGDLTDVCTSTGPHFNPGNRHHGGLTVCTGEKIRRVRSFAGHVNGCGFVCSRKDDLRHVGDLGNIEADEAGKGEGDQRHESLRTGNAGARVACRVIGRLTRT
ncbi:copper/zinc superoxide dismutase [Oesophagostomum dentatum]|uniref:Superoxide dismutase [Cu-Zn] n=1 Tax=Oesophagostomum dentatum TaxID=61180 RepID=A0A0B1TKW6_OESDE|nr:copper/zinc superoxide dismutase [Oesophagostomum dentatum]